MRSSGEHVDLWLSTAHLQQQLMSKLKLTFEKLLVACKRDDYPLCHSVGLSGTLEFLGQWTMDNVYIAIPAHFLSLPLPTHTQLKWACISYYNLFGLLD